MTALITSVRVLYSVICFLSLFRSSLRYGFIGLEKRTLIHYISIQCRKPPTTLSFCTRKHFVNQVCARTVEHSVKKRKLNIQIKWEMNKFGAQRIFPTCFIFLFRMRNHQAPLPNDAALYLLDSFLISALFLLLWLIKSIMIWDQNDSLMLFSSFLSVWIWWCCQSGIGLWIQFLLEHIKSHPMNARGCRFIQWYIFCHWKFVFGLASPLS